MPQTYFALNYHVVFSTKNRLPLIDTEIRTRLHPYLGGIIRDRGCIPRTIGGVDDHVYLLLSTSQIIDLSALLRDVKAISTGWVRETLRMPAFGWQRGYGVFAVSFSDVERIRNYIDEQEDHHRSLSYKDEFVGMLDANGIEYDERFLWE